MCVYMDIIHIVLVSTHLFSSRKYAMMIPATACILFEIKWSIQTLSSNIYLNAIYHCVSVCMLFLLLQQNYCCLWYIYLICLCTRHMKMMNRCFVWSFIHKDICCWTRHALQSLQRCWYLKYLLTLTYFIVSNVIQNR